jgi:hypothetical protein
MDQTKEIKIKPMEVRCMLKEANGKIISSVSSHYDHNTQPVGSYRPLSSTCLKSTFNFDLPTFEGRKNQIIEQIQFLGWLNPGRSGCFKESSFIGSLYSKIFNGFRWREHINALSV